MIPQEVADIADIIAAEFDGCTADEFYDLAWKIYEKLNDKS